MDEALLVLILRLSGDFVRGNYKVPIGLVGALEVSLYIEEASLTEDLTGAVISRLPILYL